MKNSKFYKDQAKQLLEIRWKNYALAYLVYMLISLVGSSVIPGVGAIAVMVVSGPFTLALAMMSLKVVAGSDVQVPDIFEGFKNFANAVVLALHQGLIIFLWSLLFVVPGVMKAYSYAMTYYILAENPNMSSKEAMNESENLMAGHRVELFKLQFSYIGWLILSVFTCGILTFWIVPQMNTATAVFYTDIKMLKYGNIHPYAASNDYAPVNTVEDISHGEINFEEKFGQNNEFTPNPFGYSEPVSEQAEQPAENSFDPLAQNDQQ